jgi:hypothetical protein
MLPLLLFLAQQPADDGAVIIRLGGVVQPATAPVAPSLPPGPRVSMEFQEADIHAHPGDRRP